MLGNIVELEGVYQNEWNSVKITAEELIKSFTEELPYEIALLKKFDELIKITEFSVTIHIKSYINSVIKPFFENPSNRQIKKLKKSIEQHIEFWPEDNREEFFNEYSRTLNRYEDMQPLKWKKWGSNLLTIISILRF